MAYIRSADIGDLLIKSIVIQDQSYIERAEASFIDIANSYSIKVADIKDDPIPFIVSEYLKAYIGYEVCFNNAGMNSKLVDRDGIEYDVYMNKLPLYEKKLNEYRNKLNAEIITGVADTREEYAYSTGTITRA